MQVGAGTMNPATFLRVLGPEPWNVAYAEPSIRPDDSRYGDNPNRVQRHTQFQVLGDVAAAGGCWRESATGWWRAGVSAAVHASHCVCVPLLLLSCCCRHGITLARSLPNQPLPLQVILKPEPGNPQELYLGSLEALGIDTRAHDVRFVEDNWESPVLGAWGLGWEVRGMPPTQLGLFRSQSFQLEGLGWEVRGWVLGDV